MKNLIKSAIVITTLTIINTYAMDIAESPNQAGGKVVLTDIHCQGIPKDKPIYEFYTLNSGGQQVLKGCYFFYDNNNKIYATYQDGTIYRWNTNSFLTTEAFENKLQAVNRNRSL